MWLILCSNTQVGGILLFAGVNLCAGCTFQEAELEPVEAAGAADDAIEESFLLDDGQLTFYGKDPYIANADRLNVESELYFIPSVLQGLDQLFFVESLRLSPVITLVQ